jgi:hypothetical protein
MYFGFKGIMYDGMNRRLVECHVRTGGEDRALEAQRQNEHLGQLKSSQGPAKRQMYSFTKWSIYTENAALCEGTIVCTTE